MVGEGRCLEVPPARGSEIPRGSETAYRSIISTCRNFIALRILPAPLRTLSTLPDGEAWAATRKRKHAKNKRKTATLSIPRVAAVKMFFFGLGCNDDKGSEAPFRTIDKRKRNARGAKGCGASRTG